MDISKIWVQRTVQRNSSGDLKKTWWSRISKSSCNGKLMTIKAHSSNLVSYQGCFTLVTLKSSGEQDPVHQSPQVLEGSVPNPNNHEVRDRPWNHSNIFKFHFLQAFLQRGQRKGSYLWKFKPNNVVSSVNSPSFPLKMWKLEMLCLHSALFNREPHITPVISLKENHSILVDFVLAGLFHLKFLSKIKLPYLLPYSA